jgi:hypothetical protein
VINTSVDTTWIFSIDNHNFTVMSTDFVPIHPYSVSHIVLGIGKHIFSLQPIEDILTDVGEQARDITLSWMQTPPTPQKCPQTPMETTGFGPSEQLAARASSQAMSLMSDKVFYGTMHQANLFQQRSERTIPWNVEMKHMIDSARFTSGMLTLSRSTVSHRRP